MNYGRIISIISQVSNRPASELIGMNVDELRDTLETAINNRSQTYDKEFVDDQGALYWLNDWATTKESVNHVHDDLDNKLDDISSWWATANVDPNTHVADDNGALDKLNKFLKDNDLFTIDGEMTVGQWDEYYKELENKFGINPTDSDEAKEIDEAYNDLINPDVDWKKEFTTEEETLDFFNDNLTDDQKSNLTLGEASSELSRQIESNISKYGREIKILDKIVDDKKAGILYQNRENDFYNAKVDDRNIQRYMMELTDKQREKFEDDSYKNSHGEYTYSSLIKFKKDVLEKDLENEINKYNNLRKASDYIATNNPDLANEKLSSEQQQNQQESGKSKWLAAAAKVVSFAVGGAVGIGLSALGGGAIATAFTLVAGVNTAVNVANFINTTYNKVTKNYQKDNAGNIIVDSDGKPMMKPTIVDKIRDHIPDCCKTAYNVISGHTKNPNWNCFVNGVSLGYVSGKMFGWGDSIRNAVTAKPDVPKSVVTNTTPTANPQPNPTANVGDTVDFSNAGNTHVAASIDGSGGGNIISDAWKGAKLVSKDINPNTGEIMCTFADNEGILGRIPESEVNKILGAAKDVVSGIGKTV